MLGFCTTKDMIKRIKINNQMKRCTAWGPERTQTQTLLSPWSWDALASWNVDVFTNHTLENFTATLLCRHNWLLTHFLVPFPLWRMGEWSWKFQTSWSFWWPSSIQEPTNSPPIKIRDALMTWEITRVLGVLCEVCVPAQSLSRVPLLAILWIVACKVPLSMGFCRQEHWSRLPFPPHEKSKAKY